MSAPTPFLIATRGSKLALWQATRTRELLLAARPEQPVELLTVESSGDADQKSELGRWRGQRRGDGRSKRMTLG